MLSLRVRIMSFVDDLKTARSGRTTVLHEFWTNYDPNRPRVHIFLEGHDDVVFYKSILEKYLEGKRPVYAYRCDGKQHVYDAFGQITAKLPHSRQILFFVDKDIDDILGQPWPTDPRIFVTDVYSIENYLVSRDAVSRFIDNFIQFRNVAFQRDAVLDQFDQQLSKFHRLVTPLMAWIIYSRRQGQKPNLSNISLSELFALSEECSIKVRPGERAEYLTRVTAVTFPLRVSSRMLQIVNELKRLPPKRFIRGKMRVLVSC